MVPQPADSYIVKEYDLPNSYNNPSDDGCVLIALEEADNAFEEDNTGGGRAPSLSGGK